MREPSPLHTTRRPGISNSDPGVLAALDSRSAPQQRTVPSLTETTALSQPRPHQQPPPSFIAESSTISIFQAHFRIGMDSGLQSYLALLPSGCTVAMETCSSANPGGSWRRATDMWCG